MAKITIAGDAYVVTSSKTLESIQTLEKYRPNALKLFETNPENGKREAVFAVGTTAGQGSINAYGASFCSVAHDGSGLATITLPLPAVPAGGDVKKAVAEAVGVAIINLNKVEAQIDAALDSVRSEKNAVMETITVA